VNNGGPYTSDDQRWHAVENRDSRADGTFYYVVTTTGLYSRPSCGSRPARRENVIFYPTAAQARDDGYRACGRCRPDEPDLREWYADVIVRTCQALNRHEGTPSLDVLAKGARLSRFHFQRIFKQYTGVSPHAYLAEVREERVRNELVAARSITEAIYRSGFNSSGHFYRVTRDILGMTPTSYRSAGKDTTIRLAEGTCRLGHVVVAATGHGVCAVVVGNDEVELCDRLRRSFFRARLLEGDRSFVTVVGEVLRKADLPDSGHALLPADILTTAFRQRVRQAFRQLAPGVPADRLAVG
jgi:AraC family transcriptional regulator, regulatory protein of adaptative response / methylated-DNA-[protein]-cysteine methyltransferase